MNSQFVAGGAGAAGLDDLAAIEREIAATERVALPLEDQVAQVEAELRRAEQHFRAHGFRAMGVLPDEKLHFARLTAVGAAMVANPEALLQSERARIDRAFQAAGGVGYSPAEKSERLAELQQRRRRLLAQREVEWRRQEAGRELIADPKRDAELFLVRDDELAAIAEDRAASPE